MPGQPKSHPHQTRTFARSCGKTHTLALHLRSVGHKAVRPNKVATLYKAVIGEAKVFAIGHDDVIQHPYGYGLKGSGYLARNV